MSESGWLSNASLARLREALVVPDLEGTRYRIVREIGRGGMGVVYEVEDAVLERRVALKVAAPGLADSGDVERMRKEARTLARLEHPGIVPVHDFGTLADGQVYAVMKLVNGSSLEESLRVPAPLSDRLRVFSRVCDAVAFAHSRGVVHRDIKPANVMIGEFGDVQVLDWGMAGRPRAAEGAGEDRPERGEGASSIRDGDVLGTPGFMAPEQERGEVSKVDERSDVFALGAVLERILAASPPIPRGLASICRRALAPDPGARYGSVRELSADLDRFRDGQAPRAHREGPVERAGRFFRRYRVPILLVATYVLVRVALLVLFRR